MKKKATGIILFFIMMLLFSATVYANTNWVALSSQSGKWITQKAGGWNSNYTVYTSYVYKVTVPATGHLRINIADGGSFDYIFIKNTRGGDKYKYLYNRGRYGVDKGTYYIYADEYADLQKFKYTYTKAPVESNYTRATAKSLAKNTRKQIAQTWNYCFTRWYKIRLTAKQQINVKVNGGLCVDLFNSKGILIEGNKYTNENGYTLTSKKVLPAGTYYIAVDEDSDDYRYDYKRTLPGGDISWK